MANGDFEIRRSVLVGDTADVYLQRTLTILRNEGINPIVTMEFAAERGGVVCGLDEARTLLSRILPETGSEVWTLDEGVSIDPGEVVQGQGSLRGAWSLRDRHLRHPGPFLGMGYRGT